MNRRKFFTGIVACLFARRIPATKELSMVYIGPSSIEIPVGWSMALDGPIFATGQMQDAIGRIYYLTREPFESREQFETRREATVMP